MTTSTETFENDTGFCRGHRVRFANGPVMTVMDFTEGEYGESMVVCGWWNYMEIEIAAFHPAVLIHTDAAYPPLLPPMDTDSEAADFQEFHSG